VTAQLFEYHGTGHKGWEGLRWEGGGGESRDLSYETVLFGNRYDMPVVLEKGQSATWKGRFQGDAGFLGHRFRDAQIEILMEAQYQGQGYTETPLSWLGN
jgi:hypothetical protein